MIFVQKDTFYIVFSTTFLLFLPFYIIRGRSKSFLLKYFQFLKEIFDGGGKRTYVFDLKSTYGRKYTLSFPENHLFKQRGHLSKFWAPFLILKKCKAYFGLDIKQKKAIYEAFSLKFSTSLFFP